MFLRLIPDVIVAWDMDTTTIGPNAELDKSGLGRCLFVCSLRTNLRHSPVFVLVTVSICLICTLSYALVLGYHGTVVGSTTLVEGRSESMSSFFDGIEFSFFFFSCPFRLSLNPSYRFPHFSFCRRSSSARPSLSLMSWMCFLPQYCCDQICSIASLPWKRVDPNICLC